MEGYATKTGQDPHGIHGFRTSLGMGHKETCPVSGCTVQPPPFLPTRMPVSSQLRYSARYKSQTAQRSKSSKPSIGIYNEIVDAALGQGEIVLSKVILDTIVWQHLSHIQIDWAFVVLPYWTFLATSAGKGATRRCPLSSSYTSA